MSNWIWGMLLGGGVAIVCVAAAWAIGGVSGRRGRPR